MTAVAVAINVLTGIITSSPKPISKDLKISSIASVPFAHVIVYFEFVKLEKSFSKSSISLFSMNLLSLTRLSKSLIIFF